MCEAGIRVFVSVTTAATRSLAPPPKSVVRCRALRSRSTDAMVTPSLEDGAGGITLAMLLKTEVDAWLRAHGKTVRPELTKKQRQELKECFDLIDADGSGAIDAEELLTAFNVLGMRVKKSEVEKMLAEVDADGSGEVEYPEFVQIMTSKLDSQTQEGDTEEKSSKQPLPFQYLAQAYRRKKLMEAVMGGDKAAQERLREKAEAAESERQAVLLAMEAEKQNPALRYDDKKIRTISDVKYHKMRRAEVRKRLGKVETLPDYVVENLDDELKNIILETCNNQGGRSQKLANTKPTSQLEVMSRKQSGEITNKDSSLCLYKKEIAELGRHRSRVRHKPVLEQQLLHLRAIKSIQEYLHHQS